MSEVGPTEPIEPGDPKLHPSLQAHYERLEIDVEAAHPDAEEITNAFARILLEDALATQERARILDHGTMTDDDALFRQTHIDGEVHE